MNTEIKEILASVVARPEERADVDLSSHQDDDSVRELARCAVYEGFSLHYQNDAAKTWQVIAAGNDQEDSETAILAGDALYAFALVELAQHEDLVAISELAQRLAQTTGLLANGDHQTANKIWNQSISAHESSF